MSCYHPLKAFDTGYVNPETGKPIYKICSQEIEFIYKPRSLGVAYSQRLKDVWSDLKIYKSIDIPCQKCIGCRLDYSRQWANRCVLEAKQWEHNAFLTLTYDDEHIPHSTRIDKETGEVLPVQTLKPSDLTKFLKDLRRYYEYHFNHTNIRFYACGEYGTTTQRPHFHVIAFNLPIPDKKFLCTTNAGSKIYLSEIISKIWNKGIISVGEVTWDSCAYTARYVMKKIKGKEAKEIYADLGLEPEFTRMSRNPGIARDYYEEHKSDIYEYDEIIIPKKDKVVTIKPAKYYDKLFDIEDPELMAKIKEQRRKTAENAMEQELSKTSLSKTEYLEVKERDKLYQIKALTRNMKEI